MKLKKILCLLLAVLMVMSAFAGCSSDAKDTADNDNQSGGSTEDDAASTDPGTYHDFDRAAKYLKENTTVLTVNGQDMTWGEYLNWLRYALYTYESSSGKITDWSAQVSEQSGTYEQNILDMVDQIIKQEKAIELYAPEYVGDLTAEDEKNIEDQIQTSFENSGLTEEEYNANINKICGSREFFDYLTRMAYLSTKAHDEQYGENGEKLSEQDILDYVADDGYMMAKHILFLTVDTATNEPLSDEEQQAALAKAEEVLADIESYDGDDLEGYFTELMNEYSEDGGLAANPDGYLFLPGSMVEEFENSVNSLDAYEVSGIVETTYGYHIIMKLPVNVDTVPTSMSSYGSSYTLRYMTSWDMYYSVMDQWMASVQIEKTSDYDRIKLQEVFGE